MSVHRVIIFILFLKKVLIWETEREINFCCSTYLWIHWLILACALTQGSNPLPWCIGTVLSLESTEHPGQGLFHPLLFLGLVHWVGTFLVPCNLSASKAKATIICWPFSKYYIIFSFFLICFPKETITDNLWLLLCTVMYSLSLLRVGNKENAPDCDVTLPFKPEAL